VIYKKIGKNSDLISSIGFGTGFHLPENESGINMEDVIKSSLDKGVNFIDTAPVYGNGLSETILGSVLQKIGRDKVFLASKVSPEDTTYLGVLKSAEDSLKRLKTDRIDLFQVHWPNPNVPISETMAAMEKLVKDGKIRHIGVSNFSLSETIATSQILKSNNLASLQAEYNFFERAAENEVLPYCDKNNIIFIAYSPLAQGNLINGKKQYEFVKQISKKYNCSPGQIVLKWLTMNSSVVVIPNTSKTSRALENAGASEICITNEDYHLISKNLKTEIEMVDLKEIRVSNDYNRKVYLTIREAMDNKMNMTPSPIELAEEMKKGSFLKPIRLKQIEEPGGVKKFDLVEGRLRYWSWAIAHGWDKKIPSLVWKSKE